MCKALSARILPRVVQGFFRRHRGVCVGVASPELQHRCIQQPAEVRFRLLGVSSLVRERNDRGSAIGEAWRKHDATFKHSCPSL